MSGILQQAGRIDQQLSSTLSTMRDSKQQKRVIGHEVDILSRKKKVHDQIDSRAHAFQKKADAHLALKMKMERQALQGQEALTLRKKKLENQLSIATARHNALQKQHESQKQRMRRALSKIESSLRQRLYILKQQELKSSQLINTIQRSIQSIGTTSTAMRQQYEKRAHAQTLNELNARQKARALEKTIPAGSLVRQQLSNKVDALRALKVNTQSSMARMRQEIQTRQRLQRAIQNLTQRGIVRSRLARMQKNRRNRVNKNMMLRALRDSRRLHGYVDPSMALGMMASGSGRRVKVYT